MSFATCCVCLELRSLPLRRTYPGLPAVLRTSPPPTAPGLSLTGVWLVLSSLTQPRLGLRPRCVRFPVCNAVLPPVPRCSDWASSSLIFAQPYQPSSKLQSGRPAHRPFRACSAFTRGCARTLALLTYDVTSYTEGFSHFVTSMTAPVASGWSVRRVGLAPTGKRRLLTAHAKSGHSRRYGQRAKSTETTGSLRRRSRRTRPPSG